MREYSIYSGAADDFLEVLVREIPEGLVSRALEALRARGRSFPGRALRPVHHGPRRADSARYFLSPRAPVSPRFTAWFGATRARLPAPARHENTAGALRRRGIRSVPLCRVRFPRGGEATGPGHRFLRAQRWTRPAVLPLRQQRHDRRGLLDPPRGGRAPRSPSAEMYF